jgi:general secretion pathway protein F
MGAYEFVVLDEKGKKRKGVLEGDNPRQVRSQLRKKQLTPISVKEVDAGQIPKTRATIEKGFDLQNISFTLFKPKIGITDLAIITRQLSTLTRSGMQIEAALNIVGKQTDKPTIKKIFMAVRSSVLEGRSFQDGLAEFPNSFSDLYRATVGAGEKSGHLGGVLERLADYTEQSQQMRQKIQLALFYPAILSVMAVLVTIALMVYVVPQVVQVFDNIGQELPALTRNLIATSEFLQNYGLYLLVAIVLAIILFKNAMRSDLFKERFQRLVLQLPLIGRLSKSINSARFTRTFSILSSSGVDVLEAMRISAQVIANLPMREAVNEAAKKVREGAGLANSLEASRLFPPMTLSLISSGESAGNLDEMMARSAENQDREVETTIAAVMGLFEPLLILAMGGIVLTIVLAILLPIFDLNQMVK